MSTYVDFKVNCPCGHQGVIHLHEGDFPGKLWENYTLEGLNGNSYYSDSPIKIPKVLEETKASCPDCKKPIQKNYVGEPVPA